MLDCGASSHLSGDRAKFTNFTEIQKQVRAADGRFFTTHGKGDLILELPNGASKTTVTLKDTLYYPEAYFTLISVGRMEAAGFALLFKDGKCEIKSPGMNPKVIGIVQRGGYLYCLGSRPTSDTATVATTKMTMTQLHRRMGHIASRACKYMLEAGLVTGLDVDTSEDVDFCEACAQAKLTKVAILKQRTNRRAAKNYGDRIHSDVWGPAQVQ